MNIMHNLQDYIKHLQEKVSIESLVKVALAILIIWLLKETSSIWKSVFDILISIFKPFIIGFAIAYILHHIIERLEKWHVHHVAAIAIVYLILFAFLIWIISILLPMLITRGSSFINSIIEGLNHVFESYNDLVSNDSNKILKEIVDNLVNALTNLRGVLPDLSKSLPSFINNTLSTITTIVISVVISIFMSLSWDRIHNGVKSFCKSISERFFQCVWKIHDEVDEYLHSLLIIMCIRFVEYTLLYLLVGHPDWLILGISTAVSQIIPFIGPISVNIIGIFTALTLSPIRIAILVIAIVVLAQVDEYVIAPLVHAKNTKITPLWSLFSIFTGSALFGVVGVIIAIPAYLALRIILNMYVFRRGDV